MKKPQAKKVKLNVSKYIAKPLAYITVFVLASYGMRQALHNINDTANIVITTLAVLGLCYIIFED